jgi:hypothetical protein
MKTAADMKRPSLDAETRLKGFIDKFEPGRQKLIRAMRKALRKKLPTAHEMVYDNYNFFVIGYGPTERPSDAILSLTGSANGVGLCFIHGASLPDPQKILLGSGNQTRFIRVDSAEVLARPAVNALISAAIAKARTPLQSRGRGSLIIRSVSTKQRPRKKVAKR